MVSSQGINIDAFEKVSVIVSIVSYVFERGNFVMKSRVIDVNGRGTYLMGWEMRVLLFLLDDFSLIGIRCNP